MLQSTTNIISVRFDADSIRITNSKTGCCCRCSAKPPIDIYSEQVVIIYSHSMRSLSLLDCENAVVATVDAGLERDKLVINIEVSRRRGREVEVIGRCWPADGTKVRCATVSPNDSRKAYCFASVLFSSLCSFFVAFDTHALICYSQTA